MGSCLHQADGVGAWAAAAPWPALAVGGTPVQLQHVPQGGPAGWAPPPAPAARCLRPQRLQEGQRRGLAGSLGERHSEEEEEEEGGGEGTERSHGGQQGVRWQQD